MEVSIIYSSPASYPTPHTSLPNNRPLLKTYNLKLTTYRTTTRNTSAPTLNIYTPFGLPLTSMSCGPADNGPLNSTAPCGEMSTTLLFCVNCKWIFPSVDGLGKMRTIDFFIPTGADVPVQYQQIQIIIGQGQSVPKFILLPNIRHRLSLHAYYRKARNQTGTPAPLMHLIKGAC